MPSGGQEAPRGLQGVISDPFCLHFRSHLDADSIPPQLCGQLFVCVIYKAQSFHKLSKDSLDI